MELRRLEAQVASLKRWVERYGGGLKGMLTRRGLQVHRRAPEDRFLLPPEADEYQRDRFYRLLHRYSFRLLLRDVIRLREGFGAEELTSYCSIRTARGYLSTLQALGIVEKLSLERWRLRRTRVNSFGETLEWFVAEILRREFFADVLHSVSFRSSPPGGDFDVLACMEGILVYIEVKSSPPRGIEAEEVQGFLRRREFLAPHLALFLVDTHLRMRDKMAPILEDALGGGPWEVFGPLRRVHRLRKEIFHAGHRIYLLNASRGILSNLRVCFLDFLRHGHPATCTAVENEDLLQ
jgi:hypothetical protein